jgi:hypothetical protein
MEKADMVGEMLPPEGAGECDCWREWWGSRLVLIVMITALDWSVDMRVCSGCWW